MKYERGMSASAVGRLAEKIVQQNLWRRNYRVKDVSHDKFSGYDLLVNGKNRIEVKSMRADKTSFNLTLEKFDILAVVYMTELRNEVFFIKSEDLAQLKRSGAWHVDVTHLRDIFTKKPQEVLR